MVVEVVLVDGQFEVLTPVFATSCGKLPSECFQDRRTGPLLRTKYKCHQPPGARARPFDVGLNKVGP